MKVHVVATIEAKPGQESAVESRLNALLEPSRRDPGCISYELNRDLDAPGVFVFRETWASREELEAHLATPHLKAWKNQVPELTSRMEVRVLEAKPGESGLDALAAIHTRRSIRKFQSQPVNQAELQTLLRAAMDAPSAGNAQPWRFITLTDRTIFPKIMEIHPYAGMLKTAPAAILVLGDLSLEKYPGNWVLDCAAAVQNLMLAARALGIGTVWTGIYPQADRMQAFSDMFKLPEHIKPHALVVLGYPDAAFHEAERFKPERVDENVFIGK